MKDIIISRDNQEVAWTLSQLLYAQVEFFYIGITRPVNEDELLVGSFLVRSNNDSFRWNYDVMLSAKEGYLLDHLEGGLEDVLESEVDLVLGNTTAGGAQNPINSPSYQDCAIEFEIGENTEKLEEDIINLWSQGYNTITLHNHPSIDSSYLPEDLQENLRVFYDLSGSTKPFKKFIEEFLKSIRRTPSEDDLRVTERFSNLEQGLIVVGRNTFKQGSYRGRSVDFELTDIVGFEVLGNDYRDLLVREEREKEKEKVKKIIDSYYTPK